MLRIMRIMRADPATMDPMSTPTDHSPAEDLKKIRRQIREECAQVALLVARRRSLAGDEAGADTARQIAKFIREDLSMDEGS